MTGYREVGQLKEGDYFSMAEDRNEPREVYRVSWHMTSKRRGRTATFIHRTRREGAPDPARWDHPFGIPPNTPVVGVDHSED